jgi:hypothetical protein
VTAPGGPRAAGPGGGGGRGRIAIYAGNNLFAGNLFANGGSGATAGQAGTTFIGTNLLISGNLIDTNGAPVPGISLQPSGLAAVQTDNNGFYSVAAPLFWTGSITPSGNPLFVPSSRSYSNVASNAPNQNYLAAYSTADFNFSGTQFDGTNAGFSWRGINGVSYQPLYSTDLLNWAPYNGPIIGTNGPAMFLVPTTNAPQLFFRLGVSY